MGKGKRNRGQGKGAGGPGGSQSPRANRRRIFERMRLATVAITLMEPPQRGQAPKIQIIGSGVMVAPRVAVTAKHVLQRAEEQIKEAQAKGGALRWAVMRLGDARAQLDAEGRHIVDFQYAMQVGTQYITHQDRDLAIIPLPKLPGNDTTITARVDWSISPLEGDLIAACGFPYGVQLHGGKTILSSFVTGIVSAVIPHPITPASGRTSYLVQMPLNPGNSGGPVFDPDTGCLIGIATRIFAPKGVPSGLATIEPMHHLHAGIKAAQAQVDASGED